MKNIFTMCATIISLPLFAMDDAKSLPTPPVTLLKKVRRVRVARRLTDTDISICQQPMTLWGSYPHRVEAVRIKLLALAHCSMRDRKYQKRNSI